MRRNRTGFSLLLAGMAGVLFFWATDPRSSVGQWLVGREIDTANQAFIGTLVGLIGSAAAMVIGLWLLMRRTV